METEEELEYVEQPPCPHCGEDADTWFDRSAMYDQNGNDLEYECFATRCCACGKNIDAPVEYYNE